MKSFLKIFLSRLLRFLGLINSKIYIFNTNITYSLCVLELCNTCIYCFALGCIPYIAGQAEKLMLRLRRPIFKTTCEFSVMKQSKEENNSFPQVGIEISVDNFIFVSYKT